MPRFISDEPQRRLPVSLIIPVRDEEDSLPALIAGIWRQTHPPAEIIIVDGGSTDRTLELARRLFADDERFRLLEEANGTPGRNRNVGAGAAACEWIAFTDAGAWPEPDWLERLADEAARDASVDVVYGNYEPLGTSFFERASALAHVPPKVEREGGRMRGPWVASMLLRRSVWREVGGFPDMRAAEDLFFMERVEAGGFRIAWAPRATVWWQLQPDLVRTFRKFTLYSKHNVWAGRQWDWHHGVARQYAVAALFVLLAFVCSPWWFLGILLWLVARVFRRVWRRREGQGLLWALSPARFVAVAVILVTIDIATLVGWAQAARKNIE